MRKSKSPAAARLGSKAKPKIKRVKPQRRRSKGHQMKKFRGVLAEAAKQAGVYEELFPHPKTRADAPWDACPVKMTTRECQKYINKQHAHSK